MRCDDGRGKETIYNEVELSNTWIAFLCIITNEREMEEKGIHEKGDFTDKLKTVVVVLKATLFRGVHFFYFYSQKLFFTIESTNR